MLLKTFGQASIILDAPPTIAFASHLRLFDLFVDDDPLFVDGGHFVSFQHNIIVPGNEIPHHAAIQMPGKNIDTINKKHPFMKLIIITVLFVVLAATTMPCC